MFICVERNQPAVYLRLVHKICCILKKYVYIHIHIINYSVIWNIYVYICFFSMKERSQMLPVKLGFFQQVTRKVFWEPTHWRMRYSTKFNESKTKGLPLEPSVSPLTRCLSSIPLWKNPASDVSGLYVSSQSLGGGPGPRDTEPLCVSFPICVSTAKAVHGPWLALCLGLCWVLHFGPCGF